jgi:hypothetical protein
MKPRFRTAAVLLAVVVLLPPRPVGAVIEIQFPVSALYKSVDEVVVGVVTGVTPANGVVAIKPAEALKGKVPSGPVRVQILKPAHLLRRVAPGTPAAVFVGKDKNKPMAVVHLADTWLLASAIPGTKPRAWRVQQLYDGAKMFPGRTPALLRIMREVKAGRTTFLDKTDPVVFRGGIRLRGRLPVTKPTSLAAADFDADGNCDLLVGTAGGLRLFCAAAAGYRDATAAWGLSGAAGPYRTRGDVNADGRPDLLLGDALWLNDGAKFTRSPVRLDIPAEPAPLAAGLDDATGDGKPEVLVLRADGTVAVLANPGAPGKPWQPRPKQTLWQEPNAPRPMAAF